MCCKVKERTHSSEPWYGRPGSEGRRCLTARLLPIVGIIILIALSILAFYQSAIVGQQASSCSNMVEKAALSAQMDNWNCAGYFFLCGVALSSILYAFAAKFCCCGVRDHLDRWQGC